MTKIHYADIVIRVKADGRKVSGPNELALSDAVVEFANEIERFIKRRKLVDESLDQFEFSVDTE